ncbi:phage/plasmid primase, P4 family [Acaricomes phytoseiuli]|uniref:phage/plasmid primase, P4 family n=1 Tax=Acaricomes phytoseiuli TaxID=291968 RepID=UPI000382020F|nr:phage/plasmid primase, P4 family [Acaricomes phytoseiuli]
MTTNPALDTALTLHKHGIAAIPVATDGTKRPAIPWKRFQKDQPVLAELDSWFGQDGYGLGVITGKVSGNLEMLEIEAAAIPHLTELAKLAHDTGLGPLWDRINTGWLEASPSGGIHWFYGTTEPVPGNTKLASTVTHQTLAETRGEGGFVVIAPTTGTAHPTGKPWTRLVGGPNTMPTLTTDERDALHALFRTLNQARPHEEHGNLFDPLDQALTTHDASSPDDGVRPGDDYENKTTWAQILEPHGWTKLFTSGTTTYWRRPGKTTGISATTGHAQDRNRLFVFTTSSIFNPETPYTKFAAYVLLNHGGDYTAAARELKNAGHGKPPTTKAKTRQRNLTLAPPAPATDGTAALATVTELNPPRKVTLTDHGNAQLFITRHGHQLRYAPSRGKWLHWDNTRWAWQEDDSEAVQAAWETITALEPQDDAERTHQHRSLSRRALEATAALARRSNEIRVTSDQLDNEPLHLNTPTGIINLTTGATEPHDPARMHTKTTLIAPDLDLPTPLWDRLLNYAFETQPETITFIQDLIGYAATGQVTHHVLPFLYGAGGNGKSVFLDTITAILGDYATSAPAGFLMAGREQHETEIARLAGTRLVVCSEVNQRDRFDEAKVKLLTGGDRLTARFMRQDHFSFTPTHTLFMMGNHQPRVESGGGESFWRRLRLLPFTRIVPEKDRIENLTQRLLAEEAPGILAWIINGALNVHQNGLKAPQAVLAETQAYADEEDALARFVADHVHIGGGDIVRTNTTHIRTTYTAWCRANGEYEVSPQVFGRELRTRFNVQQIRSNGKRFYTNMTLLDTDDLDEEQKAENWLDRLDK